MIVDLPAEVCAAVDEALAAWIEEWRAHVGLPIPWDSVQATNGMVGRADNRVRYLFGVDYDTVAVVAYARARISDLAAADGFGR